VTRAAGAGLVVLVRAAKPASPPSAAYFTAVVAPPDSNCARLCSTSSKTASSAITSPMAVSGCSRA
jgi:hypothetical protein